MNDKKFENVLSGKSFWYKEIIFGIIFLIIVFVGSAQVDKKAAESQVNSTISYVKTQYTQDTMTQRKQKRLCEL